ncbi:MAG: DEAD/DEAH box helicase [Hahellaceae bacterium]|nr:DEAD/DEAH box helicase [Hahellaceae bacterium]
MSSQALRFKDLELAPALLKVLEEIGYESPSPIQAASIPHLMQGKDILGQAQTGTGKTAAFALPLLSKLEMNISQPQVLVLAPTRELAIQVAEAFQTYARELKGFHVLPIYGGAAYDSQIRQLKRGVHVVVGTPGRVMDHMRKGTLKLDSLKALVLDEADEMLRMGFIDDVEWILEQTPAARQTALFSATMPPVIRKIAQRYLNSPVEVKIETQTATASLIRQRYWQVSGIHKLDALTRMLEVETFDGMIIFVRTKTATVELAEKLEARGYAAAALNGDISQALRERTVDQLKSGKLDILVATDVVARGLDVERISHVINYDIPYDTEAYVHRIGRTGRAGRSGDAILFVAPRERRLLSAIEKATKQKITPMQLPSVSDVNSQRVVKFKQRITDALAMDGLSDFAQLIQEYQQEFSVDSEEIAVALARLLQGDEPLFLDLKDEVPAARERDRERAPRDEGRGREPGRKVTRTIEIQPKALKEHPDIAMVRYRVDVGYDDGVKPGNLVGAIANEAGIESAYIGHIEIFDDFSTIDLPAGMPEDVERDLRKVWVCQKPLGIRPMTADDAQAEVTVRRAPGGKSGKPFGGPGRKPGAGKRPSGGRKFEGDRRPEGDHKRKPSGKPPRNA